ncbi:MAG: serine hydrolase [Eggerthellaceae bacterium]|nr:serine hydrolase [Eggerthellaceae bacterium]
MSEKNTYINDTDGRDNGTGPSGHGSAASSEHDGNEPSQRGDADSLKHGNAELSDHDSAASPERDNTASSEHGDTASPERDNVTSLKHGDTSSSKRGNAPSPEHDNEAAAQRDGVGDVSSERENASIADKEAASRSNHAEEAPLDDRSAAHAAKTACGEDRGLHAAKTTSGKDHAAHAAETASAYLQKAGNFLGLHKKASAIAAAIALCAVVGIGAAVASSSRPAPNGILLSGSFASCAANAVATTTNTAAGEAAAGLVAQRLTPNALNNVDSFATAPGTFSLMEGEDSTPLSEEQQESLTAATQNIEGGGYTVGFTLINLNTGKGIAYNLDSRVYGASSFKGPYAAFLCQHLGDNDASYPSDSEAAGSGVSSSMYSLIQPMILYSDNSAFSSLRNSYDSAGFAEWLNSCGVDSEIMHDTHFPRYSTRESALLWLRTYQYLKTNTPTAQNLASLYEQTNVSFIRSGVSDDAEVEAVLNKAGWCAGRERFTGLCDAGLIKCTDGTTYLMSTMTNSPDGGLYTVRLANLASTLFECRDVLE